MVDGAYFAQLKDMLTMTCPNPSGQINIAGENLKKIMTNLGFEFLVMSE